VLLQWIFPPLRSPPPAAKLIGRRHEFRSRCFSAVIILVPARGRSAPTCCLFRAIDFGLIVDATGIMVEAIFSAAAPQTTALVEGPSRATSSSDTANGDESHALLFRRRRRLVCDLDRIFAAAIIIRPRFPCRCFTPDRRSKTTSSGPMARTYAYSCWRVRLPGRPLPSAHAHNPLKRRSSCPSLWLKKTETWDHEQLAIGFYQSRSRTGEIRETRGNP